jgi:hypothetical protein
MGSPLDEVPTPLPVPDDVVEMVVPWLLPTVPEPEIAGPPTPAPTWLPVVEGVVEVAGGTV